MGLERAAVESRAGGVYIPPFKLARLDANNEIVKNSEADQRRHWEALRKSINGYVNKANASNIPELVQELFQENLVRGRGLLARAVLKAQLASPVFTPVFAGLIAVINVQMPEVGELLLTRLVLQYRRAYKRNDKLVCVACLKFFAHLVNQRVLSEITGLEISAMLLERPTNDSVEICCNFLQECGQYLDENQSEGMNYIIDRLRTILNEGEVDPKTQYVIEKFMDVRRKRFSDFPAITPDLDLVEADDQNTHTIDLLEGEYDKQELLDVFRPVPSEQFEAEESKWRELSKAILDEQNGSGAEENDDASSVDSEAEAEEREKELKENGQIEILDYTEQEKINLRKTVYLCIMSSALFEECVHKLLKVNIRPGQEVEVCTMLIDCSAMERTFSRFFALQAERLCKLRQVYVVEFTKCFEKQYEKLHRMETNKLRNTAMLFAHLFSKDALPWEAMSKMRLTEEDTTAASRIFIKYVFQNLADEMGMKELQDKLKTPSLQPYLAQGILPDDTSVNMRFAANFFVAIGLAPLAEPLRQRLLHLKKEDVKKCEQVREL